MNTAKPDSVVVYGFQVYDVASRSFVHAGFKAQEHVIERYAGRLLEGTAEEVDASALDAEGHYRRRATGWGELDN